jgi:hypothetical protein
MEDKTYPIKQANQIVRLKTSDGREWLASKQQWIAIDGQGNEQPEFEYGMVPLDRKNPNRFKREVRSYRSQRVR